VVKETGVRERTRIGRQNRQKYRAFDSMPLSGAVGKWSTQSVWQMDCLAELRGFRVQRHPSYLPAMNRISNGGRRGDPINNFFA
jgi:hypothetical protein